MQKLLIGAAVACVLAGVGTVPAQAQMDWLTPHLDAQRFGNQLRHNQRMAERRRNSKRVKVLRPAQVQVNGQPLRSSVPAMEKNGTTFVPMREIFESLGATVAYNHQERFVTAERDSARLLLPLRGTQAKVNGAPVNLKSNQTPFVHKGVTMVPLRLVAEGMGAQITRVAQKNGSLIKIASR
jgi:hypothetical protein